MGIRSYSIKVHSSNPVDRGYKMIDEGYETSNRGFVHAEDIKADNGGRLTVSQSSDVRPRLWVRVYSSSDYQPNLPGGTEVVAHVSLDEAQKLRDQLDYLISLG